MRFSLGWLVAVMTLLGLCLGSYAATESHNFYGFFVSIFLFLSLSLRTTGGTIQAEPRVARLCFYFTISLVVTTAAMTALLTGEAAYRRMTPSADWVVFSISEIFMLVLLMGGALHFAVTLPVALVVWRVGHLQQQRNEGSSGEKSLGE